MGADDGAQDWLGAAGVGSVDLGLSGRQREGSVLARRSTWCLIAGVVLGGFAPGHPTALGVIDIVLRAAFAGAFVLGASRAPRNAVLVSSLLLAAVVGAGAASARDVPVAIVVAAIAVVVGVACAGLSLNLATRPRWLLALAGAATAQAALRIPTALPSRAPSAAAALALAIVVMAGWPNQSRHNRRRYGRIGLAVLGFAALASAGGALSLVMARTDVERGVASARVGLDAARGGDTTSAEPSFQVAEAALRRAQGSLSRWFALPARAVPIVSQHLAVVHRLTGTAADVVSTATETLSGAQLQSFRAEGGRIDVGRMRALEARVAQADDALTRARAAVRAARGPWLVPFVAARARRFDVDLVDAQHTTSQAREVLAVVPKLLGIDGPRRYLLVIGNPAEARGSGGVIGNFGELTADNGVLRLEHFGRTQSLNNEGKAGADRRITGPADYVERYAPGGLAPLWSNVNLTPDFPSAAQVMAELYPQSGGRRVDGVVSADPVALAGLLRLTGPVSVGSWPEPITADNASKLLMFDLYSAFADAPDGRARRINVLGEVSQAVWQALASTSLPAPAAMTDALGDAVSGRHLQLWSAQPEEQRYLDRIGMAGSMDAGQGDLFGVIVNNAGANKIDWFLDRSTSYRVAYDEKGKRASIIATVVLRNTAPTVGLGSELIGNQIGEPVGSMTMLVSAYSAGTLTSATIDGREFNQFAARELGAEVHSGWLYLPPKTSTTLRFTYEVALPKKGYRLMLVRQPDPIDRGTVDVRVTTGGWVPSTLTGFTSGNGGYEASVPATGRRVLALG